jgi:DNA replication protein DnaC
VDARDKSVLCRGVDDRDQRSAKVAERRVRSIRYRMGLAKFPMDKDLDSFDFSSSPVDEVQVRSLYEGRFLSGRNNVILVGGTGTGKTHLAIAVARQTIRSGRKGRSSTYSTWSTSLNRRNCPIAAANWPRPLPGSTLWSWTNWGTCRSPETAASSCST